MKTVEVRLWDDLSDPKTVEATQTLTVGLDGTWAELDLSEDNAKALREAVQRYMKAGHEPERKRSTQREVAIAWWAGARAYARSHGYTVSPKGYVAKECREEYEKIGGPQPRRPRSPMA